MNDEGTYLYCIIRSSEARDFGPLGVGGRGDHGTTISFDDLSGVVSNARTRRYAATRENTMAHEKAIEKVMSEGHTALPVRFGTVAGSVQEVRDVLRKRHREFADLVRDMDNKVELGVKALWRDMEGVFAEIIEERSDIKALKNEVARNSKRGSLMRVGEMVKEALERKKEREATQILNSLRKIAADFKENTTYGDNMFLNAAFLVQRDREKEFDNEIEALTMKYEGRAKIKYVGPAPPFNFVNIVIHWDK